MIRDQFLTLEGLAYKYGIASVIGLPLKAKQPFLDGSQQPAQQSGVELRLDNSAGAANSDGAYQDQSAHTAAVPVDGAAAVPNGAGDNKMASPASDHEAEVLWKSNSIGVFQCCRSLNVVSLGPV